jgi:hypothetical protein
MTESSNKIRNETINRLHSRDWDNRLNDAIMQVHRRRRKTYRRAGAVALGLLLCAIWPLVSYVRTETSEPNLFTFLDQIAPDLISGDSFE